MDLNEVPTPQKVLNLNEQLDEYGGGEKFIDKIQKTLFFVSIFIKSCIYNLREDDFCENN
ncbi:hypothetical protein [Desulfosporosinus sp. BICA1-9]|uniref:hypothetical protein n=1 Tax=Desulfosporosinus sp. BICA1-9 TaxID=1531958 RepID=UPI0025C67EA7|nr:hypothetical protein [Desulfosporosinus sp. BICA1-9]